MRLTYKKILLTTCMLGAAAIGWAMRPHISLAGQRTAVDLAKLIPEEFGNWKTSNQSTGQIVNPQQSAELSKLYSQTLSRTYINADGAVVMLSIAYGADQSRDLQIHRPEVCYSAQGFQLLQTEKTTLQVTGKEMPVMRIVAKLGQRNEPITYWVRIGEKVVRGNIEQGVARLSYGLTGRIPDGVLVRVSSISGNSTTAFALQVTFINQLLESVPHATKAYLLGSDIFL